MADSLGISYQAVSKWECGTTTPDVGVLPKIAEFFDVTIDELFQSKSTVYQNKAQRLMAYYEGNHHNSEIYEKAEIEFKKLFELNNYNSKDVYHYGYLHDMRSQYHLKTAEDNYLKAMDKALQEQEKGDYYQYKMQYIYFLSKLGRNAENIERQQKEFEQNSDDEFHFLYLISSYYHGNEHEKAYELVLKAMKLFPDSVRLLLYAGDIAEKLERYDEAIKYWNKSYELDSEHLDIKYSLAFHYMKQGKHEEAINIWEQIIVWLLARGYDDSACNWPRDEIKRLKEKI